MYSGFLTDRLENPSSIPTLWETRLENKDPPNPVTVFCKTSV